MIEDRVGRLLGSPVRALRRIEGRGYSVAYRAVAELDAGCSASTRESRRFSCSRT